MRGAGKTVLQILGAAVALAVISGLVGFLVAHFTSHDAVSGLGWGMVLGGGLVGLAAGGSGSPSENLVRGRSGAFGTYWAGAAAMPESPLQIVFAAVLVFAAGLGLLILSYR